MEGRFVKTHCLNEALECINEGGSKIIAGGTDIIIDIRKNRGIDKKLVDISTLEELRSISMSDGVISIGACCTHGEIEKNEIVKRFIPILAKGCSLIGSTLIRNRGTIGGNIVNNSNCADSVPPLLILNARLIIQSLHEKRTEELKDFFKDRGEIDIKDGEIVTSIEVEPLDRYAWDIVKVGRRKSLAISRLTLAAAVNLEKGVIKDLRLCCGAVLPRNQRLINVENRFKNTAVSEETLQAMGDMTAYEVLSITGKRWSSEYKLPVLNELVVRTLKQLTMSQGGE
jgi:CO/xanthine dehydrogenase FAD-binding subunit